MFFKQNSASIAKWYISFIKLKMRFCAFAIMRSQKSLYNKHIGRRSHSAENKTVKRIPFVLFTILRFCEICDMRYCAICAFALFYITAMVPFCNIAILRHCDIAILLSKSQIAMSQIHVGVLFKGNLAIYQICYAL